SVSDKYGNGIADLVVPITIAENALDKNTGLLVGIGQTVVIGGENLHVADPGLGSGNAYADTPPYLIYTLTSVPTHGILSVDGSTLQVGSHFTQAQLDQNLLIYSDDGSAASTDSFSFNVTDAFAHNDFGSSTFDITITSNNGGRNFVATTSSDVFY